MTVEPVKVKVKGKVKRRDIIG